MAGDNTAAALIANRYRLERPLGRGATSEVFLATDLQTGAAVAIKLVAAAHQATARQASAEVDRAPPRLSREALAATRLQHPGIAAVLDADPSGRGSWLVTAFAAGVPLSRYVQPSRLLPEPLVLRLGARIAEALAHAHGQRVIHRDLKPSNVLVDLPTATVKIIDFGVARIEDGSQTRTGMTLGTPAYMAPEQLAGAPVSPASDTYSLGVMLFELLTGHRPHGGASLGELLRQVANTPAADLAQRRPDLPESVAVAVQQLLARKPQQRPADLARLATQLDALADTFVAGSSA